MKNRKICHRYGREVFASCAMCASAAAGETCRVCANAAATEAKVRYDFENTRKGAK